MYATLITVLGRSIGNHLESTSWEMSNIFASMRPGTRVSERAHLSSFGEYSFGCTMEISIVYGDLELVHW